MPSISGQVLFNVTNSTPSTGTPVSGVQIALVDNSNGNGLIIDTDSSGNYLFNNVNSGSYTIVECFGESSSGVSPGDFSTATTLTSLTPADPGIGNVPSPPASANAVQSLSRNTITPVTVVASNITGQNFVDSPVNNVPLPALDTTLVGSNLVTDAANGTWGTLPNGTIVPSQPVTIPYPGVVQGFNFVQATTLSPQDGNYSIININTFTQFNGWFNTSDHTSRDETGRLILVNGATPGALIFTQTIPNVTPNKNYLLSLWVMNLFNSGNLPAVGVRVLTLGGSTIFNQPLSNIPITSIPTWRESSTLLSVGNNSSVILQVYSNGAAGDGNDYAIDDIAFSEAQVNTVLNSTKYVDKEYATLGDILKYTITLENTGQSTVENIVFSDTIPTGTVFNTNSVTINGTTINGLNPTPPGFTLSSPSTIRSGQVVTLTFQVTVNTIPSPNPINNSAKINYSITPIVGGATVPQTVISNEVDTTVNYSELRATKSRDMAFVTIGDIITYTIPISNYGTTIANAVYFSDTIPNGTTLIEDTFNINGVIISGTTPNPPGSVNIGNIENGQVKTVSFKVIVNTIPTPNPIPNSANIIYSYTVDPSIPTVNNSSANTNVVNSQFNAAILSSEKIVNKAFANIGDVLTYTITFKNNGNVTAQNVVFQDTIPNDVTIVPSSLIQDGVTISGSSNPPGVTLPNVIAPGQTSTVVFKVTINTIPNPNPIPNVATATFTYTVDPAQSPNRTMENGTNSNTVNTQVNTANLSGIVKSVNKSFATCGEILVYTITVPNSGNTTSINVIVKDTVPSGTMFVPGSVVIDGFSTSFSPDSINIGTIPSGGQSVITFSVRVIC